MNHEDKSMKQELRSLRDAIGDTIRCREESLKDGTLLTFTQMDLLRTGLGHHLVNGALGLEVPADPYYDNEEYLPAAVNIVRKAIETNNISPEAILNTFGVTDDVAEEIHEVGGYMGYVAIIAEEVVRLGREGVVVHLDHPEQSAISAYLEIKKATRTREA